MFRGCICHERVVTLVQIDRNVDSCNHVDAIDANLWPDVCKHFAGKHFFFQSDSLCTSLSIYSSVEERKSDFEFFVASTIIGHKKSCAEGIVSY